MIKSDTQAYAEATAAARHAHGLIARLSGVPYGSPEALALDDKIRALVRPGVWEHFKSAPGAEKYYVVFDVQQHVNYELDSHRYQVSYASQYWPMIGRKALRELLGENGFLTPIWREGEYIGPRFVYRKPT